MKTEKIKVIICNKGWWEKNYFHIPKENMKELTKEEIEDLKKCLKWCEYQLNAEITANACYRIEKLLKKLESV